MKHNTGVHFAPNETSLFADSDIELGGLSTIETRSFEEAGWIGVYPLLSEEGISTAMMAKEGVKSRFSFPRKSEYGSYIDEDELRKKPWYKSMHLHIPLLARIAAHPSIASRVSQLLGGEIIAWGVSFTTRQPGQVHRWHVDVENLKFEGVSAFIALDNTSIDSTLNIIEGTHRLTSTPQSNRIETDAEAILFAAAEGAGSKLIPVETPPGSFFLFNGRLWHGSNNKSDKTRTALIIQYARVHTVVRIPMTFNDPIKWHDEDADVLEI